MLRSIAEFADYFAGIRRRTLNYLRVIPPEKLDWSPDAGEYTCRDIVRHIMAAEQMYLTLLQTGEWRYPGHAGAEGATRDALLAEMEAYHAATLAALRAMPDALLQETRPSFVPDGQPIKVWRWLMAMVEHEVHHRSQLASYLHLLGAQPPQIYGITVEELIARATG